MFSGVPTYGRDLWARLLLLVVTGGACASWINALARIFDHGEQTILVTQATIGFPVVAALAMVLAKFPRNAPGIWELLILQKAVTAGFCFTLLENEPNAALVGWSEIALGAVLIWAYWLTRGYLAWDAPYL